MSQRVAGATLGALAPAWLAAGRPAAELTAAVLHATPSMSVHRRTALLAALLPALPAVCLPDPGRMRTAICMTMAASSLVQDVAGAPRDMRLGHMLAAEHQPGKAAHHVQQLQARSLES